MWFGSTAAGNANVSVRGAMPITNRLTVVSAGRRLPGLARGEVAELRLGRLHGEHIAVLHAARDRRGLRFGPASPPGRF
jgi:hypothetical protein